MSLNRNQFEYIRTLFFKATAIQLTEAKKYLAESRLSSVAKRHGFASAGEMVVHMQRTPCAKLHNAIVDAMTTHETYFFRDGHPFTALRTDILPRLIKERTEGKRLKIWSAACSSGQETYSVALLLRLAHPSIIRSRGVDIIATDISHEVVEKARVGTYSALEMGRGLPQEFHQFFRKAGKGWEVDPELRKMIRFKVHCLVRDQPPSRGFDLILLRNVLIYFDAVTKAKILNNVIRALAPGGMLMLGSSESPLGATVALEELNFGRCRVYQTRSGAARGAASSPGAQGLGDKPALRSLSALKRLKTPHRKNRRSG